MTGHNPNAAHSEPALVAFLGLIKKDLESARGLRELPAGVAAAMRRALKVGARLDEALDGNNAL
jgi:hypothetical protein